MTISLNQLVYIMASQRDMKWIFTLNWLKCSVWRVKLRYYFSHFQVMDQYMSAGMKDVSRSHKHPIGWTDFSKKTCLFFIKRRLSFSEFNNARLQRRGSDRNDVITFIKLKSTKFIHEWQMRILTGFRWKAVNTSEIRSRWE